MAFVPCQPPSGRDVLAQLRHVQPNKSGSGHVTSGVNICRQLTCGLKHVHETMTRVAGIAQQRGFHSVQPPFTGIIGAEGRQQMDLPAILHSRYALESFVSAGRFSRVFKARDLFSLGEKRQFVAVKVLNADCPILGEREAVLLRHLCCSSRSDFGELLVLTSDGIVDLFAD
jgi:hypothetical protein